MRFLFISLLFLSMVVFPLAAEEPVVESSPAVHDEIVVTASALRESIDEVPAAVTVVTREEIAARGADDIATLLREVPGLVLARAGSDGRQTSLFTRGSNSNHTLVLWNGIDLNRPYFAGFDWGTFSTAGVERIEVVRGPFSALYGSDAVAGVVNVISETTKDLSSVEMTAGGDGFFRGVAEIARSGERLSGHLAVDALTDEGFYDNDDREQRSASASLRFSFSGNSSAGLTLRYSDYDLGLPFNTNADASLLVPSPFRRQTGEEYQIAAPFRQSFGRFSYELVASHSRVDDSFRDPEDPYYLFETDTDSATNGVRLSTITVSPFGTIVAGGEVERAEVTATSSYGTSLDDDRRDSRAFFVEDRLTKAIGRSTLEVSAGLRHDDYDTFGSELSPRLAVALRRGYGKIRAAYGEAFRAPSVGELYYPYFGNAELTPERTKSAEIGYDHYFSQGSLSATLFRSEYDDLITTSTEDFILRNLDEARSEGVEIGGSVALRPISLALSYAYVDTENLGSGDELLRRPKHSGSLSLGYTAGPVDTLLVVMHTGARPDLLPVAPFSVTTNEAHTTADLTLRYRVADWQPFVRVENLTGEEYEEVLGFEGGKRRILIGVRYSLQ